MSLCSKREPESSLLYPGPGSNRHGFPLVFETSASTYSATWALGGEVDLPAPITTSFF